MTRRTEFFTELAALMEKHKVEMEVREDCSNWQCMADGIDFDFDTVDDDIIGTVTWTGRYFDADVMRGLATKDDSK